MVTNAKTGLLVNVGDCDALADRVLVLLKNPQLARKLTLNAHKECEKYTHNRVSQLLQPILDAKSRT